MHDCRYLLFSWFISSLEGNDAHGWKICSCISVYHYIKKISSEIADVCSLYPVINTVINHFFLYEVGLVDYDFRLAVSQNAYK